MPAANPGAPVVRPADVEAWFAALDLVPLERADRASVTSWDLVLHGRRRTDLRVTVILDPTLGVICWAHYAPPINDLFRRSYRRLLRWNDEFPFAKFSVGEDERPQLSVELAPEQATADALGLALTRIVAIADALLDETRDWLWIGGREPARRPDEVRPRPTHLLERYAARLPELLADPDAEPRDDEAAAEPAEVAR